MVEIQRLNALLNMDLASPEPRQAAEPPGAGPSFGQVLADALNKVQEAQTAADDAAVKLATGQVQDVAEVMIASERANLTLNLAIQVRNKFLEAYQEIMRMPL